MLAIFAGPILHRVSQVSWPVAALLAAAAVVISRCLLGNLERQPIWLKSLQGIWLSLLIGSLAAQCHQYWPAFKSPLPVALSLVALAAWGAQKGSDAGSRGDKLLGGIVLFLLASVLISGVTDMETMQLQRTKTDGIWSLALILLLPLCMRRKLPWSSILWAALGSFLVTSVLGTKAGTEAAPFYEYSKSVNLYGSISRFESLAACAMTIGFYLLLENLFLSQKGNGYEIDLMAIGAAAVILLSIEIDSALLLGGILLLWGVEPILRKFKKDEKSA